VAWFDCWRIIIIRASWIHGKLFASCRGEGGRE
jgi:hypothetical protein